MLITCFIVVVLLFITGFYCLITTRNLIRILLALEILTKGVTLILILVGNMTGQIATAQSMVITLIIIEVVILAVAAGIIVNIVRHTGSLDIRKIFNKKE
ncbi:MAG TPA: NADH-quinone oxidoreductase subunit K [Bacteroidales bacterium]|nr:NADH-quinone oxidoreductase subunit K [Bacteroidales bacterium]HQG53308.1 NADH-quinone oxidoreductase subunit K [Bacteroidales bacterium]HQJ21245.1 NADH-quinone oxidoreductase subunit K [Bacteroidales bacterium]